MKSRLGLVTLACIAMIGLAGCASSSNTKADDPLADGVLTVGMEADYAPYNWTTNKANASEFAQTISGSDALADGYDVRMASAIAEELDVKLEIKKMTWDGLIPAVQSGSIDVIIAGMSPTEERKEQVDFSDAYHEDNMDMVVVVNKNTDFANAKTLDDLAGANISAQLGTFHADLLDQIDISKSSTAPLPDFASLIQATSSGSIDGYVSELVTALVQVESNSNLKIIDVSKEFKLDPSLTQTAIGVKKGTGLADELNKALATVDNDTRLAWMAEASEKSGEE